MNLTRGGVLCARAVIADRPLSRLRGLIGRSSLPVDEGLLLQPAPSIHTAFMRFPIDVVFLDRELNVLKCVEALRPWRTASARRARATLELPAGALARHELEVGDRLRVLADGDMAVGVRPPLRIVEPSVAGGVAGREALVERDGSPTADPNATRVLLVASDRRFRSVTAALLSRRGCAVMLRDRMSNVAEHARRADAEVVVLDASASLTAAAREAAHLEMLRPGVGVVIVSADSDDVLTAMPVQVKWGPFDDLFGAIEQARPARGRSEANGHG